MMRIVNLKHSGVYVVMQGGRLAAIEGRNHWPVLDEVKNALRRNGLVVADRVLETGR
jgi:hypothetical protein